MAYQIITAITNFIILPWKGKCTGAENIPRTGAIIAANHASYLDHFVIGTNIMYKAQRVPYYLAKIEHFEGMQRLWHKQLPAIPVDREKGGKKALKKAIQHLKKGDIIMMYPEGTRTLTGRMNRARTGVARLAMSAKVPVIPMGITNTFKILPKGKLFPRFGLKADLNIGKPLYFDDYYGKENDRKSLRKVTTKIMKEIAKLADKKYDFK